MHTYKMSIPRSEPIDEFWLLVSSDASTPTQSCQRRVGMPRDLSGRRSLPDTEYFDSECSDAASTDPPSRLRQYAEML